jgi:hypothetical protein
LPDSGIGRCFNPRASATRDQQHQRLCHNRRRFNPRASATRDSPSLERYGEITGFNPRASATRDLAVRPTTVTLLFQSARVCDARPPNHKLFTNNAQRRHFREPTLFRAPLAALAPYKDVKEQTLRHLQRAQTPSHALAHSQCALTDQLHYEGSRRIERCFCSMMFNTVVPLLTKHINPQTVRLRVDNLQESSPNCDELPGIDETLEDRILHSLTVIEARLCSLPKPPPARCRCGRHVIGNQHLHSSIIIKSRGSFPDKRRICIQIASQMPGEKPCLKVRHNPPRHLLL